MLAMNFCSVNVVVVRVVVVVTVVVCVVVVGAIVTGVVINVVDLNFGADVGEGAAIVNEVVMDCFFDVRAAGIEVPWHPSMLNMLQGGTVVDVNIVVVNVVGGNVVVGNVVVNFVVVNLVVTGDDVTRVSEVNRPPGTEACIGPDADSALKWAMGSFSLKSILSLGRRVTGTLVPIVPRVVEAASTPSESGTQLW